MRIFYFITLLLIGNLSAAQTTSSNESQHGTFKFRVDAFGVAKSKFKPTVKEYLDPITVRFLKYGGTVQYETVKGLQFGLGTTLLFNNYLDQRASFQHYASLGYVLGKHSWHNTPQVQFGVAKGMLDQQTDTYSYVGFAWEISKTGILGRHALFIRPQFDRYFGVEEYTLYVNPSDRHPDKPNNFELYEFRRITFSATIGIVFNLGK